MIVMIRMNEEEIAQACAQWLERAGAVNAVGGRLEETSAAGWIPVTQQMSFSARCDLAAPTWASVSREEG